MLNNKHFYYRLLRKYVILFGNMFNEITFLKFNPNFTESARLKVPIVYAPKDKMVTRLLSDPDLLKDTQVTLPRMSFEITNIAYDETRKQNSLLRMAKGDNASRVASSYMGVPYDISFELNVYTKNIDDGTQIVEQILPYFNPDFTITVNPVPELGFLKDIPLILNGVTQNIQYEGGADSTRIIIWTLSYTMKAYFFGPITTPKIIRTSIANIFNDPSLITGYTIRMNMGNGNNGTFQMSDTIYQGFNYDTASAYAKVISWDKETLKLVVSGAQGDFKVNAAVRSVSTNARYDIISFDATPVKLANVTVSVPTDAQPGDDFGYTTIITEWPATEGL